MSVFAVIVDGSVDQLVETKALADKEIRDLKKMGFDNVRRKEFPSWEAAEAYSDSKRSW